MNQSRRSRKKYRNNNAHQAGQPKPEAPLVFYRCPKCMHMFDIRAEAVACEASHLIPVSVKAKRFTIKPYPYTVEVTFNNGEKKDYNAESLGG